MDLQKGKEDLKLSLEKKGVTNVPQADLAFCLDVSGSFDDEHRDGLTQALLERLVPWGMLMDPDQKLDVFTFSSESEGATHVGDITPSTVSGYIQSRIINKVPGYGGATDYHYVLEKVLQNFGWMPTTVPGKKAGFFGKLMGQQDQAATTVTSEKRRSIVLFVTDGASGDESATRKLLEASEARKDEVYFLFIGVSNQGGGFPFLKQIGDRFSNTGLVVIKDIKAFVKKTNEEINDLMIGDELVQWLKK